jgi:hypothetical protein
MRTVLQLKYATRNIRGLGEKEEELDKNLNENIEISVITESTKKLQGTKEIENYTVIYKEFTDTTEASWELRYGSINKYQNIEQYISWNDRIIEIRLQLHRGYLTISGCANRKQGKFK